jgi:hypothetical protein
MSRRFERPLPVGKTGKYTFTPDQSWLGAASVINPVVTVPSGVTLNSTVTDGKAIEVSLTGVDVGGHEIHFSYETSDGQSGCYFGIVVVVEC